MSDDHVHGPQCGQVEIISTEAPLLMVMVLQPEADGRSKILVRGSLPQAEVPRVLRMLADDQERRYQAGLS